MEQQNALYADQGENEEFYEENINNNYIKINENDINNISMKDYNLSKNSNKENNNDVNEIINNLMNTNKYLNSEIEQLKKELDKRNYLDAEETRDFAYSHMKATIDHMKNNF